MLSSSRHPASIFERSRNVVDDGQQRLTRIENGLDEVLLFVAQRGLEQQARHPDDAVHRLADLMAHGREKHRLGLVGALRCPTLPPPLPKLVTQSVGIVRLAAAIGQARRTGTVAHGVPVSCYRTPLQSTCLLNNA
jgi:hypothetical protein